MEITRPDSLINNTLSFLTYRASLKNIKIDCEFSKEDLWIEVDVNQMQQVFFNIRRTMKRILIIDDEVDFCFFVKSNPTRNLSKGNQHEIFR